jgi:hypothetical protein
MRLGGPQSQPRCCGVEKKSLVPARNQTLAVQPIAILTELSQLLISITVYENDVFHK